MSVNKLCNKFQPKISKQAEKVDLENFQLKIAQQWQCSSVNYPYW